MNLKTIINETLRDIDENQKRLSLILNRSLRIANYLNDIDEIMWITYNLSDFEELKDNSDLKRDLYIKILQKHGVDEGDKFWTKLIKDYARTRTVEMMDLQNATKKLRKGVISLSVASIENKLEMLEENLKNNTLPEGLHPVDLYFKHNSKITVDAFLRNQINIYRDVLSRIQTRTYNFLVKCEQSVNNTEINKENEIYNNKNIFIIYGHNEAKWRELKNIIETDFNLIPIILSEQPDKGMTIIEKFEYYAEQCSYAFAIFTPDDVVENNGIKYFQARPNVIFELGWFCSHLGRRKVCIIFQEGSNMDIFSDFQGVIQKRFYKHISEIFREIKLELTDVGII